MHSETFEIVRAGAATLAGRLVRPDPADGPARAVALLAHCFTCSKDSHATRRIARGLAARGFAVLRFDFTGLGDSDGAFEQTNFSSTVDDLVDAAASLRARLGRGPSLLVGHSLGGAAVLAAAGRLPEVRAVATIGAPFDPAHVAGLLPTRAELDARGEAEVTLGGRRFRIREQLIDDLSEQRLRAAIAALRRPLLVLHAPRDQVVGVDNAARIFQAARHPKSFVSLDDADHLLTRPADAAYVAEVLAAWAARYVDDAEEHGQEDMPEDAAAAPPGTVIVRETGAGAFQQHVQLGAHALLADEPRDVGGDDRGPGPYDLLLAALGACTSMTMRMYARRKGWPLDAVEVTLRHRKIHARDCEDCGDDHEGNKEEDKEGDKRTGRRGMLDLIERDIRVTGSLSDEQRARLLEIADKCPVHRTLHGPIKVRTRDVSGSS